MRRRDSVVLRLGLALLLVVPFVACGGGDDSPAAPTTTPTPVPVTQASITVTCSPFSVAASTRPGFNWTITFPCTVTESAGLGANLNYVRASFTLGGVEIERREITADNIIAAAGTNRVGASSTFSTNFIFNFNRGDATGGVLTFNFTDERGNVLEATFPFGA